MLGALRKSAVARKQAETLVAVTIARSRAPVFFQDLHVADTIDGRFDLLVLHAWLVLERLSAQGAKDLAQRMTEVLFVGFDEGLRDLGASDMGLGRRIKAMISAFQGRAIAYQNAASDEADMAEALLRNVYRGASERAGGAKALAAYVLAARATIDKSDVAGGEVDFGPLPKDAAT